MRSAWTEWRHLFHQVTKSVFVKKNCKFSVRYMTCATGVWECTDQRQSADHWPVLGACLAPGSTCLSRPRFSDVTEVPGSWESRDCCNQQRADFLPGGFSRHHFPVKTMQILLLPGTKLLDKIRGNGPWQCLPSEGWRHPSHHVTLKCICTKAKLSRHEQKQRS